MFSREHRIGSEQDITRLLRSKKTIFDRVCGVKYHVHEQGVPRFVIVVSTKVDKRSVVRNHLRRQYRELCKEFLPRLACADIALLVGISAKSMTQAQRREGLAGVLSKAGLLR